jgi:CRP-like cAMP-binding protein
MSKKEKVLLQKDNILCAEEEQGRDLYFISSGKIMAFVTRRTEIIPVAHLSAGDFIGELSFFDNSPRSASLVCLEDSVLKKYNYQESLDQFPDWTIILAESLTKKIRIYDDLIKQKSMRKKNAETMKPLSIEEQRHYYQLLQNYKKRSSN